MEGAGPKRALALTHPLDERADAELPDELRCRVELRERLVEEPQRGLR